MVEITSEQLKRWYRMLSLPMLRFDCGALCAPGNQGVARCCDPDLTIPVLYGDEYRWHRKLGRYWGLMPLTTKEGRALAQEHLGIVDRLAVCRNPRRCKRDLRAIVCRTFPFEPHLHKGGDIIGLTFHHSPITACPLMERPAVRYNPVFIANALQCWKEILDALPRERELYQQESRRQRRRARKKGRRIPLYIPAGPREWTPTVAAFMRRSYRRYALHVVSAGWGRSLTQARSIT